MEIDYPTALCIQWLLGPDSGLTFQLLHMLALWLWIYENHINMWTVDSEMNLKVIFAVVNPI